MTYTGGEYLKSRHGRRMLGLFFLCAFLPVTALAGVSMWSAHSRMREQSLERLRVATKAFGMSMMERLLLVRSELHQVARGLASGGDLSASLADSERLAALARLRGGQIVETSGVAFDMPQLGAAEHERLASGGAVVEFIAGDEVAGRSGFLTMVVALSDGSYLAGAFTPDVIWGESLRLGLPNGTQVIILGPEGEILDASLDAEATRAVLTAAAAHQSNTRKFDISVGGVSYFAGRWNLPLQYTFGNRGLSLLALEDRSSAMAAANEFLLNYAFIAAAALSLVLLLAIAQIRRSLVPLDRLREGTERLARRDFGHTVDVHSGDEFEELADSFNTMARRIDSQFKHLATLAEIERGILSSLNLEKVIATTTDMVERTYHLKAAVALRSADGTVVSIFLGAGDDDTAPQPIRLDSATCPIELAAEGWREYLAEVPCPPHVSVLRKHEVGPCLELPFAVDGQPAGALIVGTRRGLPSDDDRAQLRQIAAQLAVALANTRLVDDLADMKRGVLLALARTVDAKSTWTGGHSERVTLLAVRIGVELGLSAGQLERLERGGLLHDIGKIGVPNAILDKPGPLDREEFEIVKTHPTIGARILEPIRACADVIAIVEQHHERVDGKGYPRGLVDEQIDLLAKITAVADVFDACASARPYRDGMPFAKVFSIIREGSGSHFDPLAAEGLEAVAAAEASFFESLKAA